MTKSNMLPAVSPYAPRRRKGKKISAPSLPSSSSSLITTKTEVSLALLCVLVKYWDPTITILKTLLHSLKQNPSISAFTKSIQNIFNKMLSSSTSPSIVKRILSVIQSSLYFLHKKLTATTLYDYCNNYTASFQPLHNLRNQIINNTKGKQKTPQENDYHFHKQTIQSILDFWFANTPNESQKKLWMVSASSNKKLVFEVDQNITKKFESIVYQLGTTKKSKSTSLRDVWLQNEHLYGWEGKLAIIIALDQMSRHIFRYYTQTASSHTTIKTEEIAKHYHYPLLSASQITQKQLDALALDVASQFVKQHKSQIHAGTIPLQMYVFALMPYRHSNTLSTLLYVQQCILDAALIQNQLDSTLVRFRKATSRRLNVLQDEARRQGNSSTIIMTTPLTSDKNKVENGGVLTENGDISIKHNKIEKAIIIDGNNALNPSSSYSYSFNGIRDEEILEFFPFQADMSTSSKHITLQTIQNFLHERGIYPITNNNNNNNNNKNKQKQKGMNKKQPRDKNHSKRHDAEVTSSTLSSSNNSKKTIIVSLSGGIDSMVIAAILSHLSRQIQNEKTTNENTKSSKVNSKPTNNHDIHQHQKEMASSLRYNLQIVAVHINYANRPEAHAEANYVKRFCHNYGIIYKCREISEVTRGITARDEYEKISRLVRYDFYKLVMDEIMKNETMTTTTTTPTLETTSFPDYSKIPVVLGHHKGDLRENVLSNSMKGCGPLELSGMTKVGKVEGVTIWRPLLDLEKDDIFHYSHKFGIPYFKDTTPSWSTRGKLRNQLLPLLQDIYGEGSMTNLSYLATESDAARQLLVETTMQSFFDTVKHCGSMGIIFNTHPWKHQNVFFWKFVLKDMLHSVGRGMFSDKAVISFLERIQMEPKINAGWLQCRKDYAVYLAEDGRVFVFHPDSFPFAKKDQFNLAGTPVHISQSTSLRVGPWNIQAEIIPNVSRKEVEILLEKKAIRDMDHFMEGEFSYHIKCPKSLSDPYKPEDMLVIIKEFSRTTRPRAWKGVDLKIQSTLPLVAQSKAALDALSVNSSHEKTEIVRIRFRREGIGSYLKDVPGNDKQDKLSFFWEDLIQPFVVQKPKDANKKSWP